MDPQDFIDHLYLSLLDNNWTMNEIDSMDVIYYLRLLGKRVDNERNYLVYFMDDRRMVYSRYRMDSFISRI